LNDLDAKNTLKQCALASKIENEFERLGKRIRGGGVKQVFYGAA
jgi:hypothetical protein